MLSIEGILCPATMPPSPDDALRYAVSLAGAYNADLFLCHCAAESQLITSPSVDAAHDQVTRALTDSLSRYMGRSPSAKPHWEVIVESGGNIGEEIVRTARRRCTDLIVLRSRRSGAGALLGSTAEQVSRTASCPVLVVHPKESGDADGQNGRAGFGQILLAHDFSSSSELALSYALSIAQRYGAELHLMHVLPAPEEHEPEVAYGQAGESAYHRAARRLQSSVPEALYKQCRVTQVVGWGKPYRAVLAYAKEHDVDLVCMGAFGRDFGLQALFGSNVDRVLRQASCPVLVARPLRQATQALADSRIATPNSRKTPSSRP